MGLRPTHRDESPRRHPLARDLTSMAVGVRLAVPLLPIGALLTKSTASRTPGFSTFSPSPIWG